MEIDDLRIFVQVADAGGVAAGARRLGLPKSVASRRLNRLENELGIQLLARSSRGALLTEAGMTFREHAARIGDEFDAAREAVLPGGELRGLLRVAAPLTFGPTHLAPVLAELAKRHPKLQVHACYSDRFVDLVQEGFDVAVRLGHLPDSSLVARRICGFRGHFVASPEYIAAHGAPATPAELLEHEALMQGTETWRVTQDGKVKHIHPRGRFKADNGASLVAAALAGIGIAALPDFMVDSHIANGALQPILTEFRPPEAGMYVVRPPASHPPHKVRVLTDILVERFGDGRRL